MVCGGRRWPGVAAAASCSLGHAASCPCVIPYTRMYLSTHLHHCCSMAVLNKEAKSCPCPLWQAPGQHTHRMTGTTRSASSSAESSCEVGRVDWPPTSSTSAPSATMRRPASTAASSLQSSQQPCAGVKARAGAPNNATVTKLPQIFRQPNYTPHSALASPPGARPDILTRSACRHR